MNYQLEVIANLFLYQKIKMECVIMKNIKKLDLQDMKDVVGGTYYGNGLSCNKSGCSVDWGKAISIIGNNAAANLTTGGAAGWKS